MPSPLLRLLMSLIVSPIDFGVNSDAMEIGRRCFRKQSVNPRLKLFSGFGMKEMSLFPKELRWKHPPLLLTILSRSRLQREVMFLTQSMSFSLPSILNELTPASIRSGINAEALKSRRDKRCRSRAMTFPSASIREKGNLQIWAHSPRLALLPVEAQLALHLPEQLTHNAP